jgi:hypothetical protein
VPRGKKGKLKKIKEKYADQDEEERQLRMDILKVRRAYSTGLVLALVHHYAVWSNCEHLGCFAGDRVCGGLFAKDIPAHIQSVYHRYLMHMFSLRVRLRHPRRLRNPVAGTRKPAANRKAAPGLKAWVPRPLLLSRQ